MIEAEARIATIEASALLAAVAKAWAHRFPVRYDALTAEVALDEADLAMTADGDSLSLRITARDAARMEAAKDTVVRHVDRAAGDHGPYDYPWIIF